MRENTFDVPAYKFFAWKINDGKKYHTYDDYNFSISNANNRIIFFPFENIDGLKVQEVQSLLSTSEIVIVGCLYCHFKDSEDREFYNFDKAKWFYFDSNNLKEHRDETIDKLLEEYMEIDYMSEDKYIKRMYRCFFERNQDGSYEKTKERVKRLEMQSNNK